MLASIIVQRASPGRNRSCVPLWFSRALQHAQLCVDVEVLLLTGLGGASPSPAPGPPRQLCSFSVPNRDAPAQARGATGVWYPRAPGELLWSQFLLHILAALICT